MKWIEQLENYFKEEKWHSAVELMQSVVEKDRNDVEAYIQIIYLLHYILVEAQYPDHAKDHDGYALLLKKYYDEAERKFSDNADYLFFIGEILHIAEWYFGIDEGLNKPIKKMKAFKMQKKASELCPDNDLYRWAWMFSIRDKNADKLARKVLADEKQILWLKSKGLAGCYIGEMLDNVQD